MLRTFLLFLALVITSLAWPQEYTRTLRSPATIKGFIGGESHDMYVIHAHQGQSMMVELSWKIEHDKEIGDNHADLDIGACPDSPRRQSSSPAETANALSGAARFQELTIIKSL
jgi:hypothetical protein